MSFFWVAVFGLAGVLSRYLADLGALRLGLDFPFGTLAINVFGSLLAGFLYAWGTEKGALPADLRTGLMVGFLGGFTTFSAYSLQAVRLFESGSPALAALYAALSPCAGIAAAWGGLALARGIL